MMKIDTLTRLLTSELGAAHKEGGFHLDAERRLTVMVQQGEQVTPIQRVLEVRLRDDGVMALFTEDDVYYLESSSLVGIKAAHPSTDRDDKRPGFRR